MTIFGFLWNLFFGIIGPGITLISPKLYLHAELFENWTYSEPFHIPCGEAINIKTSRFLNLTSQTNGGAIEFSCNSLIIQVHNSIFSRCHTALNGGCILIATCKSSAIVGSCFSFSSACGKFQVMECSVASKFAFNTSAIYSNGFSNTPSSKVAESTVSDMMTATGGVQRISLINSTHNRVKGGTAGLSFNKPEQGYYKFINLLYNAGGYALERNGKSTIDDSLQFMNCFHHYSRIGTLYMNIFSKYIYLNFFNCTYNPFIVTVENSVTMFEYCTFDVVNTDLRVVATNGQRSSRFFQMKHCDYNVNRFTHLPFSTNTTIDCFPGIYEIRLGIPRKILFYIQDKPHYIGAALIVVFAIVVFIGVYRSKKFIPSTPVAFIEQK
ncbi:hypothetical protein TVAG_497270 [Trichomonas vaginalis G3]|uniref:Uncharacterized protein n=1 Tax=Trichomonas vaginalis (strain ATCC PRA-98 / G3) TaxID=412133 RepID=A2EGW9_TRIV3|nr:hypothetical protein TVAGG3_0803520 [Trichomonas vaginalis G3]EAY08103.1 hypothetical protein TVAG_497270 [Trichomonas vaginalis G3]KAI5496682.1 hypothetical protein TVAGG3_0803520 [Trichomonas vaginalis G3]|eukprot:XP_001320326.1 hypothetical protein [Trichomonas vaginalis G3]